jgi:hypothetical protein
LSTKYQLIIAAILIVIAFAFGRYTTPDKVVVKTEIKEIIVEKESAKKDVAISETTEEIIIIKPDGTKIVKKKNKKEEKKKEETNKESVVAKEEKHEEIKEKAKPQWGIGGMYQPSSVYGLVIDRRIIGPVFLGVWGKSDLDFGLSVKVEF